MIKAINATGGYVGALRYGPVPAGEPFSRLLAVPEDSLSDPPPKISHAAFAVLNSAQLLRTLKYERQLSPQKSLPVPEQKGTAIYASVWSKIPNSIPFEWQKNATLQLPGSQEKLVPINWITLARHIEKNQAGSEIGLLFFPGHYSSRQLRHALLELNNFSPSGASRVYLLQESQP